MPAYRHAKQTLSIDHRLASLPITCNHHTLYLRLNILGRKHHIVTVVCILRSWLGRRATSRSSFILVAGRLRLSPLTPPLVRQAMASAWSMVKPLSHRHLPILPDMEWLSLMCSVYNGGQTIGHHTCHCSHAQVQNYNHL